MEGNVIENTQGLFERQVLDPSKQEEGMYHHLERNWNGLSMYQKQICSVPTEVSYIVKGLKR